MSSLALTRPSFFFNKNLKSESVLVKFVPPFFLSISGLNTRPTAMVSTQADFYACKKHGFLQAQSVPLLAIDVPDCIFFNDCCVAVPGARPNTPAVSSRT
jgi:hypothetical protein